MLNKLEEGMCVRTNLGIIEKIENILYKMQELESKVGEE